MGGAPCDILLVIRPFIMHQPSSKCKQGFASAAASLQRCRRLLIISQLTFHPKGAKKVDVCVIDGFQPEIYANDTEKAAALLLSSPPVSSPLLCFLYFPVTLYFPALVNLPVGVAAAAAAA